MVVLCKIAGAVFVLGGASYLAVSANMSLEQRNRELRRLYSIFIQLKSEIQYMNNTLPECFSNLAGAAKEPFHSWLGGLAKEMEEAENKTFDTIWMEGLQGLYDASALQREDVEHLEELRDKLGSADRQAQLKAFDYTLLHIERNRKELEGEIKQRKKVISTMSLFVGIMTLLLLL